MVKNENVWYHGSPSGDLRGGITGLHLGTYKAAKQALEARIGIPVEGKWDGTREYGKTLLCGKNTLNQRKLSITGFNCDVDRFGPNDDFYPTKSPKDTPYLTLTMKPAIKAYKILCPIKSKSRGEPYSDDFANHLMAKLLKQNPNIKIGLYYKNISEDVGSISVVVPNGSCIQEINMTTIKESIFDPTSLTGGIDKVSQNYWLRPDGQFIRVPMQGHNTWASMYVAGFPDKYRKQLELLNPQNVLYREGWTKVILYDIWNDPVMRIEYYSENPPNQTQIKAIRLFVDKFNNDSNHIKKITHIQDDTKRTRIHLEEGLILEKHKRPHGKKARSFVAVFRYKPSLEVLLVKDRKGRWTMPGGQADVEETYTETAWRELEEETNIVPDYIKHWKKLEDKDKITHVYYGELTEKQKAKPGTDAKGVKWALVDKIDDVKDLKNFHKKNIKDVSKEVYDVKKEIKESLRMAEELDLPLSTFKNLLLERKRTIDGYLIVMEGIDGVGKSTQCKYLKDWLENKGWKVTTSQWNQAPHISKAIKKGKKERWLTPTLFCLLNAADMIWRWENTIKPALDKGHVVICDRFYYTSYVRDMLRGVRKELLDEIYKNFPEPDLVIHLLIPPEIAMERLMADKGVKWYSAGRDIEYDDDEEKCALEYENKMDKSYRAILPKVKNYKDVCTKRPKEEIFDEIKDFVREKLQKVKRSKFKNLVKESVGKLNERLSFADLYDDTDDERIFKSKLPGMRVRSLAISMENGNEAWNFAYTSQEKSQYQRHGGRVGHKGRIIFFKDSVEPDDNAEDLECMVDCDCKDFQMRWAYADAQQDASMIGPKSLNKAINRPPNKTNPEHRTQLCKHLAALVRYLVTNIEKARQRAHLRQRPMNIFETMDEITNRGHDVATYYDEDDKKSINESIIDLRDPNWAPKDDFSKKELDRTMVNIEKDGNIYLYRWGEGNILPWKEVSAKGSHGRMMLLTKEGNLIIPDRAEETDFGKWPGIRNIYTPTTKEWVAILLQNNILKPEAKIYIGNWAVGTGDYIGTADEISKKDVTTLPDQLVFYHGTSEDRLEDIKRDGLRPMPKELRPWKSDVLKYHPEYREHSIYLTFDKGQAYYYAEKALKVARRHGHRGLKSVVLKITIPKEAYKRLLPDDDYLMRQVMQLGVTWLESLKNFSQVAYLGTIPPQWIEVEYVGKPMWHRGELVKESINKVGYNPDEEHSDMPTNWDASDVQILDKWNVNTIRQYAGLPTTFVAIYPTILDVNELDPKLAEEDPEVAGDETGGFDWEEFLHTRRGFPPVLVMRKEDGRVYIMDGNHRIWWAQQKGYRTIGAWVVDKLIQKDIDKKRLEETRIITPEESLEEGYVTLYHGTIWPIALKAKKGELGPQNLKKLVTDVLVNVFHETPEKAAQYYDEEIKHHSVRTDPSQNLLFFTTNKEQAERYAKASTKYGGEIFLDVLGQYLWDVESRRSGSDVTELVKKHLHTDEPAVVTINVPLSMVLSHPHWNTPMRDRIRDILKNVRKNPELRGVLGDLTMEVFVKEKIPARFVQRIDRVEPAKS